MTISDNTRYPKLRHIRFTKGGDPYVENMEGENRVNRLKIQRLKSRRKTRDIYKVVGCLMPYRLCALTSAQLKLSSVRFMQHHICNKIS